MRAIAKGTTNLHIDPSNGEPTDLSDIYAHFESDFCATDLIDSSEFVLTEEPEEHVPMPNLRKRKRDSVENSTEPCNLSEEPPHQIQNLETPIHEKQTRRESTGYVTTIPFPYNTSSESKRTHKVFHGNACRTYLGFGVLTLQNQEIPTPSRTSKTLKKLPPPVQETLVLNFEL